MSPYRDPERPEKVPVMHVAPGETGHHLLADLSRCLLWAAAKLNLSGDAAVIKESWLEPDRFCVLFDSHFAEIHGYLARRLGRAAADVLTAEVFLAAFRQRHRYDLRQMSARPWLYGIATRLISRYRWHELVRYRALARRGQYPATATAAVPEGQWAGAVAAGAVRASIVQAGAARAGTIRALATLRADERDAVMLSALAGLGHDEIAAALEVRQPIAASRLSQGRAKLRAALARRAILPAGERPASDEMLLLRAALPAPAIGPAPWVIADSWALLTTSRRRPATPWRHR
jgi:RNA polymerase sigma-70 factor, ECF subfamily